MYHAVVGATVCVPHCGGSYCVCSRPLPLYGHFCVGMGACILVKNTVILVWDTVILVWDVVILEWEQ